jgi:prepilin-type N-terminal cleavage/methylation domain-containing protein
MSADRKPSRGFSMLEALVALAIGGGVITAYYQAISTSLELERRTRARSHAAILAHDLIDGAGFDVTLEVQSTAGRDPAGYTWQLTIAEGANLTAGDAAPPSSAGLFQIDVQIAGPDLPGGYHMVTLRAGGDRLR